MKSLIYRTILRKLSILFLFAFVLIATSSIASAYNIWFAYSEADLPYTINVLPSSNPYSPYDEYMAGTWNLYADIFNKYTVRYIAEFNDNKNDQVDPFLTDSGYNDYFDTTGGWSSGAAVTFREVDCFIFCLFTQYSDIAYNIGTPWTTDIDGLGKLFQGTALHELGHAIGLAHNFDDMSVMNYFQPKVFDDHLMPDDVRYLYDTFPNKSKTVTDMGVWAYSSDGYQSYAPATVTPSSINPGGSIEVDGIYVGNLKNGTQSGTVLEFYLSTDKIITTSDIYIGQVSFAASWPRAVGATFNDMNFTVPSSTSPGLYYVGIIIYADGASTDSITYNNTAYVPTMITVTPPTPSPDIKANNSDGPVTINQGDNLTVTISLDPGIYTGDNADWWILLFYYNPLSGSWVPTPLAGFQLPLFSLPVTEIVNTTGFPQGLFLFIFGVDMNPNGVLDPGQWYFDLVPVSITP